MTSAPFLPQETIRIKRDGGRIPDGEIRRFVDGITSGAVTDAQIAALAMAIYFNDMDPDEGAALALAMRDSGDVLDWQVMGFDRGAPVVEKHSTGGVGDKVSLMLAPIVAASGGLVPMISGRGLGHTGGTLDKLSSIPGIDLFPDNDHFAETVRRVGCCIIGQTANLAPADRRFYAVRDITATVEAIPLITASILSKKLAANPKGLVMDVKTGSGAFMDTPEKSRALARNIVRVATLAGTPTAALITDMNQVLGRTAGNALEVFEAVAFLTNPEKADGRLKDITLTLAAQMLIVAGIDDEMESAFSTAEAALQSGKAAEVFAKMVSHQGGPSDLVEAPEKHLALTGEEYVFTAADLAPDAIGKYITAVDTRRIGMAVVGLGGGRTNPDGTVDTRVGFSAVPGIGTKVTGDLPLVKLYAATEDGAQWAASEAFAAMTFGVSAPTETPVILETIEAGGQ